VATLRFVFYMQEPNFMGSRFANNKIFRRVEKLGELFKKAGLKTATQEYRYASAGRNITGKNVYALIQGPRADATEAIVLIGAWKTMTDEVNQSGVALVLTLARYFKSMQPTHAFCSILR